MGGAFFTFRGDVSGLTRRGDGSASRAGGIGGGIEVIEMTGTETRGTGEEGTEAAPPPPVAVAGVEWPFSFSFSFLRFFECFANGVACAAVGEGIGDGAEGGEGAGEGDGS